MNIEKVIQSHHELLQLSDAPLTVISEVLWIFVGLIFIIHIVKDRKLFSRSGFIYRGIFFVVILAIVSYLTLTLNAYNFAMDENHWRENYFKPYIQSLPEQKLEVEDFSQVIQEKDNRIQSYYLNKETKPILLELTVVDQTTIEKAELIETTIAKEPIEKPYLTYKLIEKTISDKFNTEAFYETTLHIPIDYKVLPPAK
ncbi:hypothetical protein [Pseudalkalibacillus hwajinpoensis]|uniref:Uncharacterized protein n=1 Tax=Guptibacillus hwajinpoensis TaxID=208199 RepID=A0A4U1MLP0_9BACL|nr:hypothetical protein [Pseudalkalibacillus hwajinpoensis]TKD72143.1 hypothetical protein FBF83_04910 [Pseudalkalibacillus hwajinpoensis]